MQISTRELVLAAIFTALLCVLTILIRVFQPVLIIPFSLQPFVVMLAACLLSPRAAFLSILAYIFIGLIGIPVFSKPPFGGPAYILLPSFGFLLSFPLAAWVQSKLIKRTSFINFSLAGLAGIIVMYIIGLPYMYVILNYYVGNTVDVMRVLQLGFLPFITFDLIKIVIAALLALELCRRLGINRENILK
ncbi:Substrate-specific component BioY of biotin ECF transporter [Candidatus Syntrophocurvum alkaliphilum]|uniref:Biotin transporter n=1 Tax=Candidatus Syntrophocurvum alkaliphilum TaxID=2293317 RepID=A0A6I6DHD2_9FIRM|nr:biotin transporter BioY [Candidatus Syntrophocurvum alkaliphilum]QGU00503.1 Substrate-specific component BioY of biotin ECF transporter [Candidatus Syntrophocurvum alkaliphilum]